MSISSANSPKITNTVEFYKIMKYAKRKYQGLI